MQDVRDTVKALLGEFSSSNLIKIHQEMIGDKGKNRDVRIENLLGIHWNEDKIQGLKSKLRDQREAQRPWVARIVAIESDVSKDSLAASMRSSCAVFDGLTLTKEGFYNIDVNGDILTCQYWVNLERATIIEGPNGLDIRTDTVPEMVKIKVDFSKKLIFIEEKDWWKSQRGIKVLKSVGLNCKSTGLCGVDHSVANVKMMSLIDELSNKLQGEE